MLVHFLVGRNPGEKDETGRPGPFLYPDRSSKHFHSYSLPNFQHRSTSIPLPTLYADCRFASQVWGGELHVTQSVGKSPVHRTSWKKSQSEGWLTSLQYQVSDFLARWPLWSFSCLEITKINIEVREGWADHGYLLDFGQWSECVVLPFLFPAQTFRTGWWWDFKCRNTRVERVAASFGCSVCWCFWRMRIGDLLCDIE